MKIESLKGEMLIVHAGSSGSVGFEVKHPYVSRVKRKNESTLTVEWNRTAWRGEWDSDCEQIRLEEGWGRLNNIFAVADKESEPERKRILAQVEKDWKVLKPQIEGVLKRLREEDPPKFEIWDNYRPDENGLFTVRWAYGGKTMETKKMSLEEIYQEYPDHLRKDVPYWTKMGCTKKEITFSP